MPEKFRLWFPLDASVPDDLQAWQPFRRTVFDLACGQLGLPSTCPPLMLAIVFPSPMKPRIRSLAPSTRAVPFAVLSHAAAALFPNWRRVMVCIVVS